MTNSAQKNNKPLSISIPYVIYSDKDLSATAKLILGEILNLFKVNDSQCWASNDHFAEMFGLEKANVSYHIKQIEENGWIISKAIKRCDMEDCTLRSKGWHRHIFPQLPLSNILDSLSNKLESPIKYTREPIKNTLYPIKSVGMIKETIENNIEKSIVSKLTRETHYGNADVTKVLDYLKQALELPQLDLSEKINRQYAWNLLKRSKTGAQGVCWLIDLAAKDPWHKNHITSMRDLWNNQVKIIASARSTKREVAVYVDA